MARGSDVARQAVLATRTTRLQNARKLAVAGLRGLSGSQAKKVITRQKATSPRVTAGRNLNTNQARRNAVRNFGRRLGRTTGVGSAVG